MAYPYSDCCCVQGIEHFIDPRPQMPQEEGYERSVVDKPIWEKIFEEAVAKKNKEAQEKIDAEKSESISPERVTKLVVQRNNLINQGYTRLTAHQINSYYVQVNSLDTAWQTANISLIFSHSAYDESIIVPILALNTPTLIPSALLVPGELKVVATATKQIKNYAVITTNSLTFQIYDPGFKPIDWPKIRDYDIYFYYQTLAKQLLAEVKKIKENTPIKIQGVLYAALKDLSDADEPVKYIPVNYTVLYDKYSIEYNVKDFVLAGLKLENAYKLTLTLPNETLGITDVSDAEYKEKQENLGSYVFVDSLALNDLALLPVKIDKLTADLSNLPEITLNIASEVAVTTLKVAIRDLKFNRENQSKAE